ncbi:MAG TPA: hypothetical protein VE972_04440 [Conexibacter sp.]|nr:hypothetical protein [Conexibacter sp.]
MEPSDTRTPDRHGAARRAPERRRRTPPLLDQLASRNGAAANDGLDEIAVRQAELEFEYDRCKKQLELEQATSDLEHRRQMQKQTQWLGTLKILRALLFTALLVIAIVTLATGGSVGVDAAREVLRHAQAIGDAWR